MRKILLTILFALSATYATETALCTAVYDGDTMWLKKANEKPFKVRLIGLDTFEVAFNHRVFKQLETLKNIHNKKTHTVKEVLSYGHQARRYVTNKILNKKVEFHRYGKDKYGRELVYILNVNYQLIRLGLAVQYPTNLMHVKRKAYLLEASRLANLEQRGIYAR